MRTRYDVIVIGAGQAGLAMGRELARQGRRFLILDAARTLGSSWRGRWDSLRLFTPARHSALPGLPFPGDPAHHPGRDEVVAYLEAYARAFALPVALDEPVRELRRTDEGGFRVRTDHACYLTRQVVVATGAYQVPWIPPFAAALPAGVRQLHSSRYRNPAGLPPGPVIVVGGGNTGVQLAAELAATRPTTLAIGKRLTQLPRTFLGRGIFDWLTATRALTIPGTSPLGRRARRHDLLIGDAPEDVARHHGVHLAGRVTGTDGAALLTAGGERLEGTIVWATGYRHAWPWLHAHIHDTSGRLLHVRGVTPVPGLYLLGLPWLHTRASSLLMGAGPDASHLARHIAAAA